MKNRLQNGEEDRQAIQWEEVTDPRAAMQCNLNAFQVVYHYSLLVITEHQSIQN